MKWFKRFSLRRKVKTVHAIDKPTFQQIISLYQKNSFKKNCELLGSGEGGTVYRLGAYAIKTFHSNDFDYRFLEHIEDLFLFPNLYFYIPEELMVMEFVEGTVLTQTSKVKIILKTDWNEKLERDIRECVMRGILPYDVNMSNIMITNDGYIRLIDTGYYDTIKKTEKLTLGKVNKEKAIQNCIRDIIGLVQRVLPEEKIV